MQKIVRQIAEEIRITEQQVKAAIELLDGGATVPFIARYRKEVTNGLDDIQLRELEARLSYLRELEDRRAAVLKSIDEQGKLTDALRVAIAAAPTKQELEDLYLPFKQKRRTKGQMAREFGIEPLADKLFADPTLDPAVEAAAFTKPPEVLDDGKTGADFSTVPAVLDGVRDILSERWAEDAVLVQSLREWLWAEGLLRSKKGTARTRTTPRSPSFATTSTTTSPSVACPRTARWRCSGAEVWRFWRPSWCCLSRRRIPRPSPTRASPASPRARSPCTWAGATKTARQTT